MQRQEAVLAQVPPLMWRQNDTLRMNWDLLVIFLAIYNCIMIPLSLAFGADVGAAEALEGVERLVDVLFALDIFLNFRTTYINPKTNIEIVDPAKVAKHYVHSIRFPVDLFASIPFEAFVSVDSAEGTDSLELKILGVMKLIRLLRLGRIITYMKVNAGLRIGFRIVQLLAGLLILVHWIACIWYMIVNNGSDEWIPNKDMDAY